MTKDELLTIANEVYRQHSDDDRTLAMETRFDEDLGLDSLEVVELALGMEEHAEQKIPDSVMDEARTVGDLVNALTITV